ncbi:hypothetical protein OHB07_09505 [Streptomyces sp. NBC_00111]|uniref:hypothetical protein n=1 Tax=unclassified Streptomyces TaxID=2593676 RepID=UPI002E2F26A6|nr:hypothetical protein [Streptomyces sp. NBC_01460]
MTHHTEHPPTGLPAGRAKARRPAGAVVVVLVALAALVLAVVGTLLWWLGDRLPEGADRTRTENQRLQVAGLARQLADAAHDGELTDSEIDRVARADPWRVDRPDGGAVRIVVTTVPALADEPASCTEFTLPAPLGPATEAAHRPAKETCPVRD